MLIPLQSDTTSRAAKRRDGGVPNVVEHQTRIGITATKRIGNAPTRNRIRRLVREAFRTNRSVFPKGCDVVIIAKHGAVAQDLDSRAVRSDFEKAAGRMAEAARLQAPRSDRD